MIRSRYSQRNVRAERHARPGMSGNRMMFVGLALFAVAAFLVAVNIGRPYLFLRDVTHFVQGIETRPPVEVKRELQRLARGLENDNPMIQRAAIAAMKVATGKSLGDNPDTWRVWWRAEEPKWEYQPPTAVEVKP